MTGVQTCALPIYLFDKRINKAVDVYTIDGDFIVRIQHVGRGPGEYVRPIDFDIDPQSGNVLILDETSKNVIEYDCITGLHKRTTPSPAIGRFQSFIKHNGKFFFFNGTNIGGDSEPAMIHVSNEKGRLLEKHLPFDENKMTVSNAIVHSPDGNMYRTEDGLKVFWDWGNIIYEIRGSNCSPFISFIGKNLVVSDPLRGGYETGVVNYSQSHNLAFIRHSRFYAFLNLSNSEITCAKRYLDDMTKVIINNAYANFSHIWNDKMIALYIPTPGTSLEKIRNFPAGYSSSFSPGPSLLEMITDNQIQIDESEKKHLINKIVKYNDIGGGVSNPIIIMYDFKKN